MNNLKSRIAYWLLGTDRQEVREQFRRVERELGTGTELKQVQVLLDIDPSRKPGLDDVGDREMNYFERRWME